MLNLTKKQIIIIALIILVIVIFIINVFLFLSYQKKQAEIQRQAKINADIQQVQELINTGRLPELNIDQLRTEGYAPEAIASAEEAIREYEAEQKRKAEELPLSEKEKNKLAILAIITDSTLPYASTFEVTNELVKLGEKIIPALYDLTNEVDLRNRFFAYDTLNRFAHLSEKNKNEIIPFFQKKLLSEKNESFKYLIAKFLIALGEKEAFPIIIEALNQTDIVFFSEPPTTFFIAAERTLRQYTDQDFGMDKEKWQNWWDKNKDKLQWNEQKEIFSL